MRSNIPQPDFFVHKPIPGFHSYVISTMIGKGCNALVFKAFSKSAEASCACKIIPRSNLSAPPNEPAIWREEFVKANILNDKMSVPCFHVGEWIDEAHGINCVYLLSEYIDGQSLKNYLSKNRSKVTVPFVLNFMKRMLNFFYEMKLKKITHGDLHSGNILVQKTQDLYGSVDVFRITDFGVNHSSNNYSYKDDFDQLALILKELLENVNYQECTDKERIEFNVLNDEILGTCLLERDATRNPLARNPKELFERLQRIDQDYNQAINHLVVRMTTPFDYLSCEQIGGNDSLLRTLYSHHFLGLRQIQTNNNTVLTGPRGCGKSTVFKSLSLRHRFITKDDNPSAIDYIGVYFRCIDLYFAFPRFRHNSREEAIDLPVHFVTASLLYELLHSISLWANKHFSSEWSGSEGRTTRKLWELLCGSVPDVPGSDTFAELIAYLAKECKWSAEKYRHVNDKKHKFKTGIYGVNVLVGACDVIRENLPFLSVRPIYFLIDDYSSPKISMDLQENLNRLFMQRTSSCFFKLSTESTVSFAQSDLDGKKYVESREFDLVNLGTTYLHADKREKEEFIDDIFRKRLSAVPDYPVSELIELLGTGPTDSNNEVARSIRSGAKCPVHGTEGMYSICSGDIHQLISIVGGMVNSVGGPESIRIKANTPRIPIKEQNKAVRMAAGNFLGNLRAVPDGEDLVQVVTAFGNVAHSLLKFKDSQNETATTPHQASRIEPYDQLKLNPRARHLYNELLRYSVFIEDVRGKSRRGQVVPRLYLRRLLVPHFNLTFSTRDSLELEPADFEKFLLTPVEFENAKRLKSFVSFQPLLPFELGEDANV